MKRRNFFAPTLTKVIVFVPLMVGIYIAIAYFLSVSTCVPVLGGHLPLYGDIPTPMPPPVEDLPCGVISSILWLLEQGKSQYLLIFPLLFAYFSACAIGYFLEKPKPQKLKKKK